MLRTTTPAEPAEHRSEPQAPRPGGPAPGGEGPSEVILVGIARGGKSEAVRSFIREHGDLPAPQIRKALAKQGVGVSLPQIYNIKRQLVEPPPALGDVVLGRLPDHVPVRELNRVLELAEEFDGGLPRLKQIVDLIWRVRQS